jgi:hypothetical protein
VRLLFGLGALFSLLAFAIGCGSSTDVGKVNVTLAEWSIVTDPTSIPKGTVEFTIKNDGDQKHDLLILRTNIPADQLPTKADGSVNLDATDIKLEHQIDEIDGGDKTGRTFDMDAGTYVLISNLVDDNNGTKVAQYGKGMHTSFTVTEGSGSPTAAASASASPTKTPAIGGVTNSPTKTP